MDARRSRRTKDQARRAVVCVLQAGALSRWFGLIEIEADWNQISRGRSIRKESGAWSGFAIPARVSD